MTAIPRGDPYRTCRDLLFGLGALFALSSLLVNPWVGALYRRELFNHRDVMREYFAWSLTLGAAQVLLGSLVWRLRRGLLVNFSLLCSVLFSFILTDRLLLAKFGRDLWEYDPVLGYRHRPNAERMWPGRLGGKIIRTNRYGFRGNDFPELKRPGEIRGIAVGNSVTLGYTLTVEETFPDQLEGMIRTSLGGERPVEVINTAVAGYSSRQELEVLRRSLRFQPDFALVGFCMNDVTEPYLVDRSLGGMGLYHGITQITDPVLGRLYNATGFSRVVASLTRRGLTAEMAAREETFNVRHMSQDPNDAAIRRSWDLVLADLMAMGEFAAEHRLPTVLLVFPYTFHVRHPGLRHPQRILHDFAEANQIDLIDFTDVFEALTGGEEAALPRYFVDGLHLSGEGNGVVAGRVLEWVKEKELLP